MSWNRANSTLREWQVIVVLLAVLGIPLATAFHFSQGFRIQMAVNAKKLSDLAEIYKEGGIDSFLQAKRNLRGQVSSSIKNPPSEEAQLAAINIATYLFPEVLPDSNFEKQAAMDLWVPFQKAIEQSPGTSESRVWFEELRANIWNYENPDKSNPALSPYAKEMLRIYSEMSSK